MRAAVARQTGEAELAQLVAQAAARATSVDSGRARLLQLPVLSSQALPLTDETLAAMRRDWQRNHPLAQVPVEQSKTRSEQMRVHLEVPDSIERPQPRQLEQAHHPLAPGISVQALFLPSHELGRYCVQRAKSGSMAAALAEGCRQIGQRMLDQADTVLGASYGVATLAGLAKDEDEREAALAARLQLDWMTSGRHLPDRGACLALDVLDEPCTGEEWMYEAMAELDAYFDLLEPGMTEMQRLRDRIKTSNQPDPPADWLESQRTLRAAWGR